MGEIFNLKNYLCSDEYINNKDYAKLKYFFKYLKEVFPDTMYEDDFFVSLGKDDFLLALEYYIEAMNGPAQNTVWDYQRAFFSFMENLSDYGIRNSTIFDNEKERIYKKAANDIINELKPQENIDCLDDVRYEMLITEIDKFLQEHNTTEVLRAIKDSKNKDNRTIYNGFVSVLAIKLVMLYGLKNNRVRDLTINGLNLENKILQIDSFELPLSDELVSLFEKYLHIRENILKTNGTQSDFLFITIDGTGYDAYGQGYSSSLFAILQKKDLQKNGLPKIKPTQVGYKRIVDLLDRGANIATLANLTGHSAESILDLYQKELQTSEQIKSLVEIFKETKGLIKCPFCGKKSEAVSDNWVLREVNVRGMLIKRIACKACKGGADGKYRY